MRLLFRPVVMDLRHIVVICCLPSKVFVLCCLPGRSRLAGLLQASPWPAMGLGRFLGPKVVDGLNRSSALGTGQGPKDQTHCRAARSRDQKLNREEAGSNIINSSWEGEG